MCECVKNSITILNMKKGEKTAAKDDTNYGDPVTSPVIVLVDVAWNRNLIRDAFATVSIVKSIFTIHF